MMTNKEAMIRASGHFLSRHFPPESVSWEDEDYIDFIENNSWEPLEYFVSSDLLDNIDVLAREFMDI